MPRTFCMCRFGEKEEGIGAKTSGEVAKRGAGQRDQGARPGVSRETGRIGDRAIRSRGRFRSGAAARRSGSRILEEAGADQEGGALPGRVAVTAPTTKVVGSLPA